MYLYNTYLYLPTRRRSCAHVGRCSEQREISNDRDAAATLSLRPKRPKTSLRCLCDDDDCFPRVSFPDHLRTIFPQGWFFI